jgi:hypothetical protein
MHRSNWRLDLLGVAVAAVVAFNLAYFNGVRSWHGAWVRMQGDAASIVIAIVAIRFLIAWIFAEKSEGWKVYLILLLLSPFLVSGAFVIARQFLPPDLR